MTHTRYTLGKKEKLKGRKAIELLFAKGESFTLFPFRVVWMPENRQESLQAGMGVSARHFKKAVERNRIRRWMKEAYRLRKNPLLETLSASGSRLSLFILYTGHEMPDYERVFEGMGKVIDKLIRLMNEKGKRAS